MSKNKLTENFNFLIKITILFLISFYPEILFAQADPFEEIDKQGQGFADWLTGNFMAIVGVVAIVAMAVATAAGKLDWRYALTVGLAILIGLYAQDIVSALRP